jgi:signal transduction histidine kinase
MLVVAFVPMGVTAWLTLRAFRESLTRQARVRHTDLAHAASALLRDYVKDGTTKLKSIAQLIRKNEDPLVQTQHLNKLLDPPDIFLEVSYWTVGPTAEVQAQVQQRAFNDYQDNNKSANNRAFNPKVKQNVAQWTASEPILNCAANGMTYVSPTLEKAGDFLALPISVPAPGGAVLTANLDFAPVQAILFNVAGHLRAMEERIPRPALTLEDKSRALLAESCRFSPDDLGMVTTVDAGLNGWTLSVHEAEHVALAAWHEARGYALNGLLGALLLTILLAALTARRVIAPVRRLSQAAEAVGRGDLSARSGIVRADEIGQLALAFDRMAAAVQQLDTLKSDFVSHVSHELRTPLTSAKVALANVQEGLSGPDAIPRIQQDLDRLIRMVNELLDVARIEAGVALAKQPTDLGALVRSSADTLRPLARVPLEVAGSGDTLPLDPARVQQILVNLVDNALKYARSRVDVTVAGREVRVADDGPGVPLEHRERIFEKFSKVQSGPKPPGAGLGLSIARKLAQLHGGSLVCEGNAFVLRL